MVKRKKDLSYITLKTYHLYSDYLEREVLFDIYMPLKCSRDNVSLLLINDGQDLEKMPFEQILNDLYVKGEIENLCCVGIHCGADRKLEYGTAFCADYVNRGNRAGLYTKFIFDELLPFLRSELHIQSFREKSYAGFSLGGLSALDIVWNHTSEFSKVGVFSGSLWWRRKAYEDGYTDEKDRLMHLQVKYGQYASWLKFYFQCGTQDETSDRNNNGIIDSIDDVMDLISHLKHKGYTDNHIKYIEMKDGRHDVATWAKALPDFLTWGWGKADR